MKNLTAQEIIDYVINRLELDSSARCISINLKDDLYELELRTLLVKYDIYADALTGDIVGISTEPDTDEDNAYEEYSVLVA